jgi:hypothetical protein
MNLNRISPEPGPFRARVVVPLPLRSRPLEGDPSRPAVDIVIPARDRPGDLAGSVRRLHAFLAQSLPFTAVITIVESADSDGTSEIAAGLMAELSGVRVLHVNMNGHGRALAAAWLTSEARVVAYIDLGQACDLTALLPLIAPVLSGHTEISSRGFLVLQRGGFGAMPRCGFLAMRADVARRLVPAIFSRGRFFDAELLVRAGGAGLHVYKAGEVEHELPKHPGRTAASARRDRLSGEAPQAG